MKLAPLNIDPIVNETGRDALQLVLPQLNLRYAGTRFMYELSENIKVAELCTHAEAIVTAVQIFRTKCQEAMG